MRRNGFFALGAETTRDDMLRFTWHQAVDNRVKEPIITGTLCDACERPCHRKDFNGVFRKVRNSKGYEEEIKKCWQ
ncbi:MAG: hypothetical protein A4E73_01693 [Syntrophaceae bacterium PtaU1.Bin231]|nr:MAG: hypothetical protein A4E73_01693 [Syntrophaceae bacterium PtaU1.Bin231]